MLKILSSTVMLPKDNFKTPLPQFIKALEVAKNGCPKIIGIEVPTCEIGFVSKTIKSIGK